jgi:uncharacterized protein (DUF488 family)
VTRLATIGYQGTTVDAFRRALENAGIELLVDIRAVASSRLPGFSKTRLAANVNAVGIDYVHLRDLATPADGRAAARAGHHAEMRTIFFAHLKTEEAQAALDQLERLVRSKRRVCVLCFEADPMHCHRTLVAESLASRMRLSIVHLRPAAEPAD